MNILVIDNDETCCEALRRSLNFNGYTVTLENNGRNGFAHLENNPVDLVILDADLPDQDGLEVCRAIRTKGLNVGVVFLTKRAGVSDRVTGLDAGADDYLPKPFALEELLARIRSVLRRTKGQALQPEIDPVLRFADLTLNPETREVTRSNIPIELTRTEFSLLELLIRNPRRVMTRSAILEYVWGYDFPTSGNALEVYVGYLRRKTEVQGMPRLIYTVRGIGYVLKDVA